MQEESFCERPYPRCRITISSKNLQRPPWTPISPANPQTPRSSIIRGVRRRPRSLWILESRVKDQALHSAWVTRFSHRSRDSFPLFSGFLSRDLTSPRKTTPRTLPMERVGDNGNRFQESVHNLAGAVVRMLSSSTPSFYLREHIPL